jgi:hypothetical protein
LSSAPDIQPDVTGYTQCSLLSTPNKVRISIIGQLQTLTVLLSIPVYVVLEYQYDTGIRRTWVVNRYGNIDIDIKILIDLIIDNDLQKKGLQHEILRLRPKFFETLRRRRKFLEVVIDIKIVLK